MYMFSILTNVSSFKWLWSEIFVYVQNERSSQPPAIPLHTKHHFIIRYSASTGHSISSRALPPHTHLHLWHWVENDSSSWEYNNVPNVMWCFIRCCSCCLYAGRDEAGRSTMMGWMKLKLKKEWKKILKSRNE